ncbi:4Fe-4S binding protein [Cobetia sp. UCD-24C]|uniref:4Fe-4S binding protein n=1 Tax=Cobetia sp. UCD-24C TaxID=1716176 RepID=UPI0006C9F9E8|nr:4Fe-4S binding protein [Cobetia sp. UCD-24C]
MANCGSSPHGDIANLIASDGGTSPGRQATRIARFGQAMQQRRGLIQLVQWLVVGIYAFLLVVPALLPLPDYQAHILTNLTVFAEFVFWGLWWPFVLISMVLMGRVWCGVFCPEGTLTEAASRIGLGRPIPGWMRWGGWPFVAFLGTTLYGQLASVYQYPLGALVVLGGSTVAAIIVGLIYGKGTRVWCRQLCPVNGVFNLLARLSPTHFRTDQARWNAHNQAVRQGNAVRMHAPDCAPLIPLKQLDSAGDCHVCGRCSGYKDAMQLEWRAPGAELVEPPQPVRFTHYSVLVFGLLGIAIGAFSWSASPWFVALKQQLAFWLIDHDLMWPLTTTLPTWILTNYPEHNDVFNLLDGSLITLWIVVGGGLLGALTSLPLLLGNWLMGGKATLSRLWHLSLSLIPLGGLGVFLGLSATTMTLLRGDGINLTWANDLRATLLALACLWGLRLAWRITGEQRNGEQYNGEQRNGGLLAGNAARLIGTASVALACLPALGIWYLMFWGW